MIKETIINKNDGFLFSGSGKKYKFNSKIYFSAVKFLMKKFKINFSAAKSLINYFLVTDLIWKNKKIIHQYKTDKKTTSIRLKNIISCDYSWDEFYNK